MSPFIRYILLVFEEITQIFFPLSEDERLVKRLTVSHVEQKLAVRTHDGVICLTHFSDPDIRALIHLTKFHHHPRALQLTSELLTTWLTAHAHEPTVLIPIPLSTKRYRQRGYNQVELIIRASQKALPKHVLNTTALRRVKHTTPQTSLTRAERLRNMTDAFSATAGAAEVRGKHVIIIDDVMTTGATLKAARAVLTPYEPTSLQCLAIAH